MTGWELAFWTVMTLWVGIAAWELRKARTDQFATLYWVTVLVALLGVAMVSPYVGHRLDQIAPVSQPALREIGAALFAGAVVGFLFVVLETFLSRSRDDEVARLEFRRTVAMTEHLIGLDGRDKDFTGMHLRGKSFAKSNLSRGDFSGSNLDDANFHDATMTEACFVDATMRGIHASGCTATGSDFTGADLRLADLRNARLDSCKFVGANLSSAFLTSATLDGADLSNCDLRGTTFMESTNNDSVGFAEAMRAEYLERGQRWPRALDLSTVNLAGIIYDHETAWPRGFEPPTPSAPSDD